ncbi:MAG: D-alanine--D-alanine ligase [Candidatus Kerfeldbacteria bacterium]|nr:D-alanine--D-alanine ligase [Candidatus Kerfeldbacteria bacterium]
MGVKKKLRIGLLFGGRSAEHDISLQSAKNVLDALDRERYEPVLIGIDRQGKWHLQDAAQLLNTGDPKQLTLSAAGQSVTLTPGGEERSLVSLESSGEPVGTIDVVFPVLHGPFGEDGTVQGLLKLAGVPFVGAGVLGSAVGMDKDVAKRLLRDAGISVARFVTVRSVDISHTDYDELIRELGPTLFIKPANLGSSVGVHKVENRADFEAAVTDASLFDTKLIIEEAIQGREIECAVLGNEHPKASVPGEIIPNAAFYTYEAKYIDEHGARLDVPARLDADTVARIQAMSVVVFQVLGCEGMARVDFFLTPEGRLVVNEINSIPGFTRISMYPKLWEASGLPYPTLIDQLIQLAIERFQRDEKLKTSYT